MTRRILVIRLSLAGLLTLLAGCVPGQIVKTPDPPVADKVLTDRSPQPPPPPDPPVAQDQGNPAARQALTHEPEPTPATITPLSGEQANPPPEHLPIAGMPPAASSLPAGPPAPGGAEPAGPAAEPRQLAKIIIGDSPQIATTLSVPAALKLLQEKGREEEVRRCLSKLEEPTRELLLQLLRLSGRRGEAGPSQRLTSSDAGNLLQKVDAVGANLRPQAPLLIPEFCICNKIKGFGNYEPRGANPAFEAGDETQRVPGERVLVYVEVRNFASQKVDQRHYRMALSSKLEIHPCPVMSRTATSRPPVDMVFHMRDADCISQTPRQDFFLRLEFNVPDKVPPGCHKLRVLVRDEIGLDPDTGKPREAEREVYFTVKANGFVPHHSPVAETTPRNGEE